MDTSFFAANLAKILDGGWIPLAIGAAIFLVMVTWRTGFQVLRATLATLSEPADQFLRELAIDKVPRVPGTAVFLTRATEDVPAFIVEYVRNMGALHAKVIALNVRFEEQPRVDPDERGAYEALGTNFWRATVSYGFNEKPDLPVGLSELKNLPPDLDLKNAVFFGTRDLVTPGRHSPLSKWRGELFAYLYRNSVRATDRFHLPAHQTVEVARQIEI